MKKTEYPSDLTGQQLSLIKPCLNIQRQSKWPLLDLVNAILYICSEGVQWRALPTSFGIPWQTAYWYFSKWSKEDCWQAANEQLVLLRRTARPGASPLPASVSLDTQTVANTPTASKDTGIDAGKRTKGRKRLFLVDAAGNLIYVLVFAASLHDGTQALRWWIEQLSNALLLQEVVRINGDAHFGGRFKKTMEQQFQIQVCIPKEPIEKKTNAAIPIHKKRWVVERTIAWETTSRRLARDYERKPSHSEAFCLISSIKRMLHNPICLN